MFGALLVCVGELLLGTYNDAEELGTTWWYEIRARCVHSNSSQSISSELWEL